MQAQANNNHQTDQNILLSQEDTDLQIMPSAPPLETFDSITKGLIEAAKTGVSDYMKNAKHPGYVYTTEKERDAEYKWRDLKYNKGFQSAIWFEDILDSDYEDKYKVLAMYIFLTEQAEESGKYLKERVMKTLHYKIYNDDIKMLQDSDLIAEIKKYILQKYEIGYDTLQELQTKFLHIVHDKSSLRYYMDSDKEYAEENPKFPPRKERKEKLFSSVGQIIIDGQNRLLLKNNAINKKELLKKQGLEPEVETIIAASIKGISKYLELDKVSPVHKFINDIFVLNYDKGFQRANWFKSILEDHKCSKEDKILVLYTLLTESNGKYLKERITQALYQQGYETDIANGQKCDFIKLMQGYLLQKYAIDSKTLQQIQAVILEKIHSKQIIYGNQPDDELRQALYGSIKQKIALGPEKSFFSKFCNIFFDQKRLNVNHPEIETNRTIAI